MKTRSQVLEERRKKAEAEATKGAEPSAPVASLTLKCPACKETVTIAADAPRNGDGCVECSECGCALDPKAKATEPEPIPEPETKHAKRDERPKETAEPPQAYCNMCGAAWPRVDGRPFPNCGHADGFVYDRSEAKELKQVAGHPIITDEEKAKHAAVVGAMRDPAPHNPKRPPEPKVTPALPSELRASNVVRVEWGKMTFDVAGYGVNITVGPFAGTAEVPEGGDRVTAGARLLQELRMIADTAFAEQLAWYTAKVGIIEKKLRG